MLFEARVNAQQYYEEWLDAKQAYENYRNSYIPYLVDEEEFDTELRRLEEAMDEAEYCYRAWSEEYDEVFQMEYPDEYGDYFSGDANTKSLKELEDRVWELRWRYERLEQGSIPFAGDDSQLRTELERVQHEYEVALNDYSAALDKESLRRFKEERETRGLQTEIRPWKRTRKG